MDRYTRKKNPDGWPEIWPDMYELVACEQDKDWCEEWKDSHECKCDAVGDAVIQLGKYEDSELLPNEVMELKSENSRLAQWVNDLQSGMYVNCVYCGHRYGPEETTPVSMADVLKRHIEQCPKHPMSALNKEIANLTVQLDAARERAEIAEAHNKAVSALPNCNDCMDVKTCTHRAPWGKLVRFNCPIWRGPASDGVTNEPAAEVPSP